MARARLKLGVRALLYLKVVGCVGGSTFGRATCYFSSQKTSPTFRRSLGGGGGQSRVQGGALRQKRAYSNTALHRRAKGPTVHTAVARKSAVSFLLAFALGVHYRGDHRVSQLVGGLQTRLLYARFAVDPEADLFPSIHRTQHTRVRNRDNHQHGLGEKHAANSSFGLLAPKNIVPRIEP